MLASGDDSSWGVCRDVDVVCWLDEPPADAHLPGAAPHGQLWADEATRMLAAETRRRADRAGAAGAQREAQESDTRSDERLASVAALPASPAALLRYLQSDAYREQQAEEARAVNGSFRVLTGSPWLLPRPVLVLALRKPDQEHPVTFTLPTRVEQEGVAPDLAKVLKNARLASALSADVMRDGVVCFERAEHAESFAALLEGAGHLDVLVTEVDSHKLFRITADAQAVVVLVGESDVVPQPAKLAAALRGTEPMDNF